MKLGWPNTFRVALEDGTPRQVLGIVYDEQAKSAQAALKSAALCVADDDGAIVAIDLKDVKVV